MDMSAFRRDQSHPNYALQLFTDGMGAGKDLKIRLQTLADFLVSGFSFDKRAAFRFYEQCYRDSNSVRMEVMGALNNYCRVTLNRLIPWKKAL